MHTHAHMHARTHAHTHTHTHREDKAISINQVYAGHIPLLLSMSESTQILTKLSNRTYTTVTTKVPLISECVLAGPAETTFH